MRFCAVWISVCILLFLAVACNRQAPPASAPASAASPDAGTGSGPTDKGVAVIPERIAAPGVIVPAVEGKRENNGLCYVCHQGMKDEELTHVHEAKGVLCVHCHGPSSVHMEDEMLMTEPDIIFGRIEIEAFCRQCHGPHRNPLKVDDFVKEWYGRDRPNGRAIYPNSICTDCHGTHNVAGRLVKGKGQSQTTERHEEAEWKPLFDGKSLTGWKPSGGAQWAVESGSIVGKPGAGEAGGELLLEQQPGNFLLTCTYRIEASTGCGMWFRYQSPEKACRVAVGKQKDAAIHAGSVQMASRWVAICADPQLEDPEGWNTISVRCENDLVQVWLNGRQVAGLQDATSRTGAIGFQMPQGAGAQAKLSIREVLIQPLKVSQEQK